VGGGGSHPQVFTLRDVERVLLNLVALASIVSFLVLILLFFIETFN
jgi:hypothetical protein